MMQIQHNTEEGKATNRNPRLSCDAWNTLYALEAQRAWGTRHTLDSTGAVGALDAFGAQFPSTARLQKNKRKEFGASPPLEGLDLPQE